MAGHLSWHDAGWDMRQWLPFQGREWARIGGQTTVVCDTVRPNLQLQNFSVTLVKQFCSARDRRATCPWSLHESGSTGSRTCESNDGRTTATCCYIQIAPGAAVALPDTRDDGVRISLWISYRRHRCSCLYITHSWLRLVSWKWQKCGQEASVSDIHRGQTCVKHPSRARTRDGQTTGPAADWQAGAAQLNLTRRDWAGESQNCVSTITKMRVVANERSRAERSGAGVTQTGRTTRNG